MMNSIAERLTEVRNQISAACQQAARPTDSVQLLAVSKTKPVSDIAEAIAAQQHAFGENYVQEGVEKIHYFAEHRHLQWHFIGPIQSNKTRLIAEHFDWVHSVDREKIAQRLASQRPSDLPPLNVLIQINIDDEQSKAGIAPAELPALAAEIAQLPRLQLRGLMTIPRPQAPATSYADMQRLFLALQAQYPQVDTLSMGMSDDLAMAIHHGATLVRVGSAIFGARASRNATPS